MVISPVPNTHPNEVWYRFTAVEWNQLPNSVCDRIRTESRAYVGKEVIAMFTATLTTTAVGPYHFRKEE